MLAEKAKVKAGMDDLATKISNRDSSVTKANAEIDRAFDEYAKVLSFSPDDKSVLNEIATNYYNYKRYEGAAKNLDQNA